MQDLTPTGLFLYLFFGGVCSGVFMAFLYAGILWLSTKLICSFTPNYWRCYFVSLFVTQFSVLVNSILVYIGTQTSPRVSIAILIVCLIVPWIIAFATILVLIKGPERESVTIARGILVTIATMILPSILMIGGFMYFVLVMLVEGYG